MPNERFVDFNQATSSEHVVRFGSLSLTRIKVTRVLEYKLILC